MIEIFELIKAVNGELISTTDSIEIKRISTDSRDIEKGDLFIPLVGENFDGHKFINSAFEKGAVVSLSDRNIDTASEKNIIIKVDNTFEALGKLAKYYRSKFTIPVVAITGSVGKTTTKNIIADVLRKKYNVLKTAGNFNNEIGLPLTIFRLEKNHTAAVVELGMSAFGEISKLSKITKPDIAVITNIGMSHIENLGSKQNILKAKMEILDGLKSNGLILLNGDDSLLKGMKNLLKYKTKFFGMEEGLDYQAYNINSTGENGSTFEITIGSKDYKIVVPVPGIHNIYNALAALAVGKELSIPIEDILEAILEYEPEKMRMEIIELNKVSIINDVYNASPQSVEASIRVLSDIRGVKYRKVAILGDMLELGEWSEKSHYEIGKFLSGEKINFVFAVGKYRENIVCGAVENGFEEKNIFSFKSNKEVNEFLKDFLNENDFVLIKGSRGVHMEEIVNFIKILDQKSI